MKKKSDKLEFTTLMALAKVPVEKKIKVKIDESYLLINQVSFQQNFRNLIGHYKIDMSQISTFSPQI